MAAIKPLNTRDLARFQAREMERLQQKVRRLEGAGRSPGGYRATPNTEGVAPGTVDPGDIDPEVLLGMPPLTLPSL